MSSRDELFNTVEWPIKLTQIKRRFYLAGDSQFVRLAKMNNFRIEVSALSSERISPRGMPVGRRPRFVGGKKRQWSACTSAPVVGGSPRKKGRASAAT